MVDMNYYRKLNKLEINDASDLKLGMQLIKGLSTN